MTLVVDASIACKWFVPEPDSPAAEGVIRADPSLIAPSLIIAECGNIFWRKWRLGEISESQSKAAVARLPDYFATLVLDVELRDRAIDIALELDHPIYDAFYLALAERTDCALVTADARLRARVGATPWRSHVITLANLG